MARNVLPHVWTTTSTGHWIEIKRSKPHCAVRSAPSPNGQYMWTHGKQFGYALSVEAAKDWAEAAREFWPRRLP